MGKKLSASFPVRLLIPVDVTVERQWNQHDSGGSGGGNPCGNLERLCSRLLLVVPGLAGTREELPLLGESVGRLREDPAYDSSSGFVSIVNVGGGPGGAVTRCRNVGVRSSR